MITSFQMRAARAMLGIDQRQLAQLAGLSLPTIQRMEASDGVVRGNVDSLMKLVDALAAEGIELIVTGLPLDWLDTNPGELRRAGEALAAARAQHGLERRVVLGGEERPLVDVLADSVTHAVAEVLAEAGVLDRRAAGGVHVLRSCPG